MRELSGWEMLLGGALLIFLLWRWRPARRDNPQNDHQDRERDWAGFLLPILLVVFLVLAMIAVLRG